MPGDVVIRAEGLGKKYTIGHEVARPRYRSLRESLARAAAHAWRRAGDIARGRMLHGGGAGEEFWALRDVGFEVRRGEVVGIIGRNGAGKSTLLKVLSRITEPTCGRVTLHGRVASLLEVGTGFHPELTGRENVYLNGAILGMSRAEIRRKFDEIVAFAEVERFIDTPVKRFSSGMYVRLAFAVAAHLEPEILIVDEVLAVGDVEFQKKCLGKMGEVARGGRTVLFVSHNMPSIVSLCSRALLLAKGRIVLDASAEQAVAAYLGDNEVVDALRGRRIDVRGCVETVRSRGADAVRLVFDVTLRGPLEEPLLGLGIDDAQGRRIATVRTDTAVNLPAIAAGQERTIRIAAEPFRFSPGTLLVRAVLVERGHEVEVHDAALRLIVPHYTPFRRAIQGWPLGPALLTIDVDVDAHALAVPH
jgi:ABC-type polysaccharide/polyol phosphate transport system ATPase subunit